MSSVKVVVVYDRDVSRAQAYRKFTMQFANEGCGEVVAREGMAAYIA